MIGAGRILSSAVPRLDRIVTKYRNKTCFDTTQPDILRFMRILRRSDFPPFLAAVADSQSRGASLPRNSETPPSLSPSCDGVSRGRVYKPIFHYSTLLLIALFLAAHPAHAVDLYWDINSIIAGSGGPTPSGSWGTALTSNWNTDSTGGAGTFQSTTATDDLHFSAGTDATGAYTVTTSGNKLANNIFFDEGTVTISPATASQTLTLSSGASITNSSGNLATIGIDVVGTSTLSVLGANSVSFARVSGVAALTMTLGATGDVSTRVVTLGNSTGGTPDNSNLGVIVNSGTLLVTKNTGNAAPSGVTVNNSGTLFAGAGTVGPVTVNTGAKISPGTTTNGTGILNTGALTFNGTSAYLVDISGSTSDKLAITSSLNLSGTTDQITFSGTADGTTTYVLATYGSVNGTFNTVNNLPSGYQLVYGTNELDMTPVPEPSTWAAGVLMAAALGYSQRRRLRRLVKSTA